MRIQNGYEIKINEEVFRISLTKWWTAVKSFAKVRRSSKRLRERLLKIYIGETCFNWWWLYENIFIKLLEKKQHIYSMPFCNYYCCNCCILHPKLWWRRLYFNNWSIIFCYTFFLLAIKRIEASWLCWSKQQSIYYVFC